MDRAGSSITGIVRNVRTGYSPFLGIITVLSLKSSPILGIKPNIGQKGRYSQEGVY